MGHVLNRTGGRGKVKANLADTDFIDNEVGEIKERNEQVTNKFLQTANANTGFADVTQNRTNQAMGVGDANNMLGNMRMEGMEGAFNAGLQNEVQSQQSINQLIQTKAQMEQFNAQVLNNEAVTNFMANRGDTQNIFNAASAGVSGYFGQRRDDQRFNQTQQMNQNNADANRSMWDQYMSSVNNRGGVDNNHMGN